MFCVCVCVLNFQCLPDCRMHDVMWWDYCESCVHRFCLNEFRRSINLNACFTQITPRVCTAHASMVCDLLSNFIVVCVQTHLSALLLIILVFWSIFLFDWPSSDLTQMWSNRSKINLNKWLNHIQPLERLCYFGNRFYRMNILNESTINMRNFLKKKAKQIVCVWAITEIYDQL